MARSQVNNEELKAIRDAIRTRTNSNQVKAREIAEHVLRDYAYKMDESTIRGRFIEMGEPLSGVMITPRPTVAPEPVVEVKPVVEFSHNFEIKEEMKRYIPEKERFDCYIERGVDKRLALHYDHGKHPITQGKQGTGKTFSHEHYAFKRGLPLFLYSCYEDFKLNKLFGDKTIVNGSVKFMESLFVQAIQGPSVILFDEVNAVSNKESFPFHALLQNRELFVKDADDGNGKVYRLHPDCRIGFSQNPKSAKYLGGNVKPSNFLGRCTFITYPEFTKTDIKKAISKKFPALSKDELESFATFYFACLKAIDRGQIPVDISIRQLNSVIELYLAGLPLRESIEDGLSSIMDAASQSQNKEVFFRLAQGVWRELMDENECNRISKEKGFMRFLWGGW